MSTLAGLLNHQVTAGQALTRTTASPMASPTSGASGTGSSSDSSDSSATISANDFLTLLVTEMQNQDPTADTDPNEYINQLVQVNSLEQLIDINQTLSTDVGSTSSASDTDASNEATPASTSTGNSAAPASASRSLHPAVHVAGSPFSASSGATVFSASPSQTGSASPISGNLSAPRTNLAAERVGHALAGRTHAVAAERRTFTNQ